MRGGLIRVTVAAFALLVVGGVQALAQSRQALVAMEWVPFKDERLGYAFTYPAKIFQRDDGDPTEPLAQRTEKRSGQAFRSSDGRAYLQAVAFENFDRLSLPEYRARVAATYQDGKVDYERSTPVSYVISGIRGRETFYERVYLTCAGQVISAWSMHYPAAEGALYDRIVEEVSRSYRPAQPPQACP